eukprot:symbB.v1.2.002756.t1/scaffold141.1/size300911/7
MTDCRGLSEEEAKMLLELELLAATTEARSKHEVSQRPKSKRNLGHRMRAVKEEEEEDKEERAASTLGFKIEVEYDADWTQESEGSRSSVEMTIFVFFTYLHFDRRGSISLTACLRRSSRAHVLWCQ